MKKTYFNRDEDICWPPQCHKFGSTAGAGGFTAGAAAPAVNMLEEALARLKNPTVSFHDACIYNVSLGVDREQQ